MGLLDDIISGFGQSMGLGGNASAGNMIGASLPTLAQGILGYVGLSNAQEGANQRSDADRAFLSEQNELERQAAEKLLLQRLAADKQIAGQNALTQQQAALLNAIINAAGLQQRGGEGSAGVLQKIADQVRASIV